MKNINIIFNGREIIIVLAKQKVLQMKQKLIISNFFLYYLVNERFMILNA